MANSTNPAVEIRRLWPADMPAFRDHLLRLDARSRHERFGGGMSDDFIVDYAESCFGQGDLVFGAFVGGQMHGAGELRSSEAIWTEQAPFQRHIHAEAAFSVEEPYRRRGIGEQMFRRILGAASNHGVETVDIVRMPDNAGMMRLAAKFKTEFSFEENQIAGRLTARRPTPFSLMSEASRDFVDFTSSLFHAQLRAIQLGLPKSG
jgi:GNAT superfamily N-acetyltransferase